MIEALTHFIPETLQCRKGDGSNATLNKCQSLLLGITGKVPDTLKDVRPCFYESWF
jgi:hypothetical protein